MKDQYCNYSTCKAVAEFETTMGNYCPYHFKVMQKKKKLAGKKIEMTNTVKEMLKLTRLNPAFTIKLKRR
jgi:hypothetical protein